MYVEINSRTEIDGEPQSKNGKKTYVNDPRPTFKVEVTAPKHIGSPPWHIEISEESNFSEIVYCGDTPDRQSTRKLSADLTNREVWYG